LLNSFVVLHGLGDVNELNHLTLHVIHEDLVYDLETEKELRIYICLIIVGVWHLDLESQASIHIGIHQHLRDKVIKT
jgi:hypothetical protein